MSQVTQIIVPYYNPPTLSDISSLCIVRNIENFVNEENISDRIFFLWKDGLSFSDTTLEQFFQTVINYRGELDARWITLFLGSRHRAWKFVTALGDNNEGVCSKQEKAEFSNVTNAIERHNTIDSTGVLKRILIYHNVSMPEPEVLKGLLEFSEPLGIMVEDCSNFDSKLGVLGLISAHFPRLITLKLYCCGRLLTQCIEHFASASPLLSPRSMEQLVSKLDLSHLRLLTLRELPKEAISSYTCLLEQLADRLSPHLLQLDLSDADFSACASFEWLSRLRRLRALILADCQLPKDRTPLIASICALSDLIRFDIAHFGGLQSDPAQETWIPFQVDVFENPSQVMQQLSEKLPQLDHLDLSGTNLPGVLHGSYEKDALPGWPSDRRLSFLGLWACPSDACRRENLPAYRITGDANEAQLLAALDAYAERPQATCTILRSLINAVTRESLQSKQRYLQLLLERMQRYSRHRLVQISSAELLFYLIRRVNGFEYISSLLVQQVVERLTDTLEHFPQADVVRACSATLYNVPAYDEFICLSKRLVQVLLRIAEHESAAPAPLIFTFDLLRHIVRQLSVPEKHMFGDVGGVRVALAILERHLQENEQNSAVFDSAWGLLCSATDETPANCRVFVELGGLELFVRYIRRSPGQHQLYHTMLILVGNVAEVKSLREYLKNDQLIAIFLKLLDMSDANEVSYNTACVLSFMLADGEDLWHQKAGCDAPLTRVPLEYSRAAIGERIVAAIDRWNPNDEFFVAYLSLLPILLLITTFDSFASQYWAAWTLNNLTLIQPEKYCPMFLREAALNFLDTTIADTRSPDKLRHWLVLTADRIREYLREQASGDRSGASSPHVLLVAYELMDPDDSDDPD